MKNIWWVAELFHGDKLTDRQTDRRDEANSSKFLECVKNDA
jgi:hypothetical protein